MKQGSAWGSLISGRDTTTRRPSRRGTRSMRESEPPTGFRRIMRAGVVGFVFLAGVIDQCYRPDLSRQREVLTTQISEATARVDRAKKELEFVTAERERIAKEGVPEEQKSRWTGEPYQSVEHCLFDYDRRIGTLQQGLAQVVAQAEGYSAELQTIDAGGGRRVPFANRIFAWLRKGVGL